jgi:hypothetical protein
MLEDIASMGGGYRVEVDYRLSRKLGLYEVSYAMKPAGRFTSATYVRKGLLMVREFVGIPVPEIMAPALESNRHRFRS